MRGIHLENPACDCPGNLLSRLQLAGQDKVVMPYALHYRCAIGGCSYFSYVTNQEGGRHSTSTQDQSRKRSR